MTGEELIREIYDTYSEWIEMSEDPSAFVAGVLASKIIKLKDNIDYLNKRLDHECARTR